MIRKIILCITSLILFSIAYYFLHLNVLRMSENYVERKKSSLQKEFYDKLNEYWAGESRLMFSEEYTKSSYVPMDMEAVQLIDNRDEKDIAFYGAVERLFPYDRFPLLTSTMFKCLNPGCFKQLYELNAVKDTPWKTFLLKYETNNKFRLFVFAPVAVGYLQSMFYMKEWRPSLDESCAEALEYLVEDYNACYNKNNSRIVNNILTLYNQYYYLQQKGLYDNSNLLKENNVNFEHIRLSPDPEGDPLCGHQISWIYNSFYRVYYDVYPRCTYEVAFNDYNYNKDKDIYYSEHFFVISHCFWLMFILLLIYLLYLLFSYYRNHSKTDHTNSKSNIELETLNLYKEILEKSNPKIYITPYQPDKLTIANEIYSKALKNSKNRDVLEELLNRIKNEL